jgi:hypothetical protein
MAMAHCFEVPLLGTKARRDDAAREAGFALREVNG